MSADSAGVSLAIAAGRARGTLSVEDDDGW